MRRISVIALSAVLASCGTLPQDGPSTRSVVAGARDPASPTYGIVELTYAVAEIASQPPARVLGQLSLGPSTRAYDTIAPGDVLAISVLEPGGALFGGATAAGTTAPTTASQALPNLAVDRTGSINVPFAGAVNVAGLTAQQAAAAVRRALLGKAVNPQVLVSIQESTTNGVTILGAAATPGRLPLRTGADTILDLVGAAGGPSVPPEDVMVSITREGRTVQTPLLTLLAEPGENIALAPGDRVNLIAIPRKYSTFGALGTVSEVTMSTGDVTLTGALSASGGLDNQASDARAVFVFRFETPVVAESLGVTVPRTTKGVPVIYRLNLAEPAGFFTANSFIVRPGDVIYNPRAGSAELRKFFEFVQSITRVIYDVTVTGTLGNVN